MKAILNWRYYVMTALMAAFICCLCANPVKGDWLAVFLSSQAMAAFFLICLRSLVEYWSSCGKIPEFDAQFKNIP